MPNSRRPLSSKMQPKRTPFRLSLPNEAITSWPALRSASRGSTRCKKIGIRFRASIQDSIKITSSRAATKVHTRFYTRAHTRAHTRVHSRRTITTLPFYSLKPARASLVPSPDSMQTGPSQSRRESPTFRSGPASLSLVGVPTTMHQVPRKLRDPITRTTTDQALTTTGQVPIKCRDPTTISSSQGNL